MDWQTQLYSSFGWFWQTLLWVCALFGVLFWVLIRHSAIGRRFWAISHLCLTAQNIYKTIGLVVLLVAFVLIEVRISVLNTFFYNGLYTSLQEMDARAFWFFALINASLVGIKIIQEIVDVFIGQFFEIKWLEKLNTVLVERWLAEQNYYRLMHHSQKSQPDNIDQRIEQDAAAFITDTLELFRGVLNAVLSSIEFTLILWGLSGILVLFGVHIHKGVVFLVYFFIIGATVVSVWIGRPLIGLNFEKEHRHGDYRYALVRLRDHAESIAFYKGETQEKITLLGYFRAIIDNRWQIIYRSLGLNGFNTGVTQFAMLLPIMLQAPRFFAGQIKLGDVHQTVQSFNRLMRALSFFRLFYESFTLYAARINRLYEFLYSLDNLPKKTPSTSSHTYTAALVLQDFTLTKADGSILFAPITIQLYTKDRLLIQGRSGIGKTSLLRAMAGIYPLAQQGVLSVDLAQTLHFMPQKTYIPQGTLKQVLTYPNIQADDTQLVQLLHEVGLGKFASRLYEHKNWQQYFSPGQAQRIGFVRIFLARPTIVFLDEATSALDESNEQLMYRLLQHYLPCALVISIGHRQSLHQYHNKTLYIQEA